MVGVDTAKISAYLKTARRNNSLTQLNVADRLGLTPQAVSKWERGESMPDITLLPELAKLYNVAVEDILTAGAPQESGFEEITRALNAFVDERLFNRVLSEFKRAQSVRELTVPLDIFMALGAERKDILLELLLGMEDCGLVIDDILQYLNAAQRARLILRVAENGDYDTLETLIPFASRAVRTELVTLLLARGRLDFLEEMLLYLNRAQKELIIRYFVDNHVEFDALESFMPFFDKEQRGLLSRL